MSSCFTHKSLESIARNPRYKFPMVCKTREGRQARVEPRWRKSRLFTLDCLLTGLMTGKRTHAMGYYAHKLLTDKI